MLSAWPVRLLVGILALQAGICTLFLVDACPALRHREEGLFQSFLGATRQDSNFVLDEVAPASRVRIVRPLEPGGIEPYLQIGVTEDPERLFESYPLSPVDWAIILNNTNEAGCKVAGGARLHPLDNAYTGWYIATGRKEGASHGPRHQGDSTGRG